MISNKLFWVLTLALNYTLSFILNTTANLPFWTSDLQRKYYTDSMGDQAIQSLGDVYYSNKTVIIFQSKK